MIPHEYIEELTRRTDIVDLVGSYVQLKRKGRLYGGLCPFHSEKTPSFYVYPDTQSFYCFGCGAGGDAITFAKKINSISYGEAVKLLAGRAGMPEPQEDDKTGRMRSRILSMNKEAARFFHACLNSTVEEARQARAYWRRRGLDDKTIVRFGLGYAPHDGQALDQFLRERIPQIRMIPSEGTYLVWLDCSQLPYRGMALEHFMINEAKVAFCAGYEFGKQGEAFLRMNVACPRCTLTKALEQMEKAINGLSLQ